MSRKVTAIAMIIGIFMAYVVLKEIVVPRALSNLGKVDDWWSPVRVLPPQGEFYIMVKNTPQGPFDSIVESIDDHSYNAAADLFAPDQEANNPKGYLDSLGLAYVGLNKAFLVREFHYEKWERLNPDSDEEPRWGLVPKMRGVFEDGKPPSYFWRYDIAILIDKAEIKGNAPIDGIVDMTIEIESPRRAFFFEGGFIAKVNAATQAIFREHVGSKTLDEIREDKMAGATGLVAAIKNLSGETRDTEGGLRKVCGTSVSDARFVKYGVTGSKEMIEATQAVEIARLQRDAAKLRGQGKRMEREEEAEGIKKTVEAFASHPVGATVAQAEALKDTHVTAMGGNIFTSVNVDKPEEKKDEQ